MTHFVVVGLYYCRHNQIGVRELKRRGNRKNTGITVYYDLCLLMMTFVTNITDTP